MSRVERRLGQVVDGAGGARGPDGLGAAGVAEHDHLRPRILLDERADRRRVGERRVDQHGVVRVLADRGERGGDARDPVDVGGAVGQQPADAAAVVLVGGDEQENEGRIGHGPNPTLGPP